MEKLRIYSAHPRMLHEENLKLIEFIKQNMDVEVIDPFDHPYTKMWDEGDNTKELAFNIVEKDLKWIISSDAVVAFYPEYESIGTPMEIWFAKTLDLPIFVLTKHLKHPWMMYCECIAVRTQAELVQALKNMLPWRD